MYNKLQYATDPEFRQRMLDRTMAWQQKVQCTEEYKAKRREISKRYYQNNPEYREQRKEAVRMRRLRMKQGSMPPSISTVV
jgi:hypothetical protein